MLSWHCCCCSLKHLPGLVFFFFFSLIDLKTQEKIFHWLSCLYLIIGKQCYETSTLKAAQSSLKMMCHSGCVLFTLTRVESKSWSFSLLRQAWFPFLSFIFSLYERSWVWAGHTRPSEEGVCVWSSCFSPFQRIPFTCRGWNLSNTQLCLLMPCWTMVLHYGRIQAWVRFACLITTKNWIC